MNARLILIKQRKRVWTTQLTRPESTLGRAFGCTVRIPSAQVSRLHCRLGLEDGLLVVEDLESVNGTFLNGKRIHEQTIVRPGDHLSLGSVMFLVEYQPTPEGLRRLGIDVNSEGVETDTGIEPFDDATEEQTMILEPVEDVPPIPLADAIPLIESVEMPETEDAEGSILDEDEDLPLPEGGDLRDFLIELDETDDHSPKTRQ